MPPSHAAGVHTFEAVAGSWRSVSIPAVGRVMSGAPEREKIAQKYQYTRYTRSGNAVARIFFFFWGGGSRPMPPSLASVVHTFEAVAGSWRSVSIPAVGRVMSGAPERKK